MQSNDYTEANRAMWNETADIHAQAYVAELFERVKSRTYNRFDEIEKQIFADIGLQDKAVIQLGCNNGRELISVKKAGAGRCVGVDISDKFIEQANKLARVGNVDIEFVRTNIYDVPHTYDAQFDLVYVTIGVLGWLDDLDTFFGIVARLLKLNGQLFLYDMHPILNMFTAEKGLEITDSYFRTEPFVEGAFPDYMDPTKIVQTVSYWFPHKMSDVIGGCLAHGLALTHFQEYPHDISAVYAPFEQFEKKPPLSFSLIARKTNETR